MTPADLVASAVSLLSLLVAALSFLQTKRREGLIDERDVLQRLVTLETQVGLVWKDVSFAASFAAAATLHREDDGHGLDAWIDAFLSERLDRDDLGPFVQRLQSIRSSEGVTARERHAADVLIRVVAERYGFDVSELLA